MSDNNDSVTAPADERPWGHFVVLEDAPGHKVKRIVVTAGHRLSYQLHYQRSEHWFIVEGTGLVTIADEVVAVGQGHAIDVAMGIAHRIENNGEGDLVFIEIQHGEYFGEDDIVRLDDDYGRGGQN